MQWLLNVQFLLYLVYRSLNPTGIHTEHPWCCVPDLVYIKMCGPLQIWNRCSWNHCSLLCLRLAFKQEPRHFTVRWLWCDTLAFSRFGYLSFSSPLYSRCSDAQSAVPCFPLLSSSVSFPPPPLSSCMRFCRSHAHGPPVAHCLTTPSPFWPAGTRRRGASPSGSAALAARSKGCSRAQPWRGPCCRHTGWWRERTIWWGCSENISIHVCSPFSQMSLIHAAYGLSKKSLKIMQSNVFVPFFLTYLPSKT